MSRSWIPALLALAGTLAGCRQPQAADPAHAAPGARAGWGSAWVPRSGAFPSAACVEKSAALVRRMTLAEKVGQMTQASRETIERGDIRRYALGSILSGGGSAPGDAGVDAWADMLDWMHAEALTTRLRIPLIYGSDAVHGHGNVVGATIFPHNIGLGATRDTELVRAVARATAIEMARTGVDWTFAPAVGVARDERWGRTYETFSEVPEEAGLFGAAAVRGYQGDRLGSEPTSVLACAKHFAGDGNTVFGSAKQALLDQGDARLSEADFRRLAVAPYRPAIAAGVGSVMVSFSSLNGEKLHGHRRLITEVLKGELGFRGFVVSDWQGIEQLPGSFPEQVVQSVNAGIDLFMEPYGWKKFIPALVEAVERGQVPMARIDDAVQRIVTVKCEAGLFEKGPVDRSADVVGSRAHRELARRAVQKSLVLLKNDGALLPLAKTKRLLVAGTGARSLTRQAGGWTVGWQGAEDKPFPGTTLFDALRAAAAAPELVSFEGEASAQASADAAVLVMSEPAYAEGRGDSKTLEPPPEDVAALDRLHARGLPVVVVLYSGRPLILEPHLAKAAAWVAAWLPGSAGEGVADVLYGDAPPSGKLSHSWPRRLDDVPVNLGDPVYDPLFPHGHGLGYDGRQAAPAARRSPAPRALLVHDDARSGRFGP